MVDLKPDCECHHHRNGTRDCAAERIYDGEKVPWVCTRPAGHKGSHVACGGWQRHDCHTWNDEPQSATG